MLNKTRELIGYLSLFVYYLFSVWVLDFTRVCQRVLLLTKSTLDACFLNEDETAV